MVETEGTSRPGLPCGSGWSRPRRRTPRELFSDPDDLVLVEVGHAGRAGLGPPRAWIESGLTLSAVAGEQLVEPAPTHIVRRRQLGDRAPRPQVCLDQESALVHRRPLPPRCLLCLDTSRSRDVAYVLNSHTSEHASRRPSVTMIKPSCRGGGIRAPSLHSSLLFRAWRGGQAPCASAALACGRSAYRSGSSPCRGARCGAPSPSTVAPRRPSFTARNSPPSGPSSAPSGGPRRS